MKLYSLVFFMLFTTVVLLSCDPEPEVIIETVTVIDTVTIIETVVDTFPETATTFILIRHAETTGIGSNPNLSTIGIERADRLSEMLQNISLTSVFSTDFNRTQETAAPTASNQGLPVEVYNPADLDGLAESILSDHLHEVVLVVGHSNTTPDLLNVLVGNPTYTDLPETEYDNLFIVSVYDIGLSDVLHLKY